ncbi:hypothetical protein PC129_g15574 [Phytophthora cactorum]|uniref:Uncharacterized protein n=1 Tax=Phytophthora cactorum TaxID=29920 RepID=A0A329RWG9_9STRA|nr:hypothetical protein Pcac1_g3657 [Phytophthora cactorum]KAG2837169.1 hypothetical protein PC112_g5011 [Phytophthora cactorum]KAG2867800.1 hypothetical protein PC113_g1619 [Phytophthora cactorum]KAG3193252.1 hypothetical protein C6341_g189 [Phytophthora cactorum]KAG3213488.1 hypothetical protein PC129_g15574 [Phytophthora cactorum]
MASRVVTVTTLSDTSEPELGRDTEDVDGLLLHLIRTIALYLFVFLSQTAKLVVMDAELACFAATPDLLDEQSKELQRRLHTALFAWVQSDVKNNQFDGLLQEQRAFVVIKRLFRQQRTQAAAQCRALAALLTSYLTRLETPLVYCEPSSMLSSTLEYLLAKEKDAANKEPVPLPMLYPLVNAVDLASTEQRECLDALMNLFRWLSAHDQSQKVFTTFTNTFHGKIIGLTEDRFDNDNSSLNISGELGVCFVQMLLRYSDHIFRRDLQFEDMVPTLSYSDTEDDDASSEDGSARLQSPQALNDNLSAEILETPTNKNYGDLVLDVAAVAKKESAAPSAKMSLHKRKKREEKATEVPVKSARSRHAEFLDEQLLSDEEWEDDEPLPTVVCFGIAVAAGTLAALLCVFFN